MWECELYRWGREWGMMKSSNDFLLGEKKLKENLKKINRKKEKEEKETPHQLSCSRCIKPRAGNSF